MKQKKPEHCYMCPHHHKAGHKKGTALHGSKFDNWCCKFSTAAPKAVSVCLAQNGKPSNALAQASGAKEVEETTGGCTASPGAMGSTIPLNHGEKA